MISPRTVHRVWQKVQIPMGLLLSLLLDLIWSNATFLFGENLMSFDISNAVSNADLGLLYCVNNSKINAISDCHQRCVVAYEC